MTIWYLGECQKCNFIILINSKTGKKTKCSFCEGGKEFVHTALRTMTTE